MKTMKTADLHNKQKTISHKRRLASIGFFIVLGCSSCESLVEVDLPPTQLFKDEVFNDDATAIGAMSGVYSQMMETNRRFCAAGITFYFGLAADELANFSSNAEQLQYFSNTILATNSVNQNLWGDMYKYIYSSNAVIEKIPSSTISRETKKQLEGEGKFVRAFCYFYLVNIFGEVPLITTTDWQVNSTISKSTSELVYNQIIADLLDAYELLDPAYGYSNGEHIRPNKWAAAAMLARTLLYREDWAGAEQYSSAVINSGQYELVRPDGIFLRNSNESIWQLMPVLPNQNTPEGSTFILTSRPSLAAASDLLRQVFEPNDQRKQSWVDSITVGNDIYYYPTKYKVRTGLPVAEYSTVLRLGEQYLIRAEARAHLGEINGSIEDIEKIRNRANLGLTDEFAANPDPEMIYAQIDQERQIELMVEWGHRWFDLKRQGKLIEILSLSKSVNQNTFSAFYPIPEKEILTNPNIIGNSKPVNIEKQN